LDKSDWESFDSKITETSGRDPEGRSFVRYTTYAVKGSDLKQYYVNICLSSGMESEQCRTKINR
jgi:hypothetical protein